MTEIYINVTDLDDYNHQTKVELILGELIPLYIYDFENQDDWIVGAADDDATAGIWEVGIPIATFFEGTSNGEIIKVKSGTEGFGYDPIFIPYPGSITFGQMSKFKKINIDHRYIAFRKLKKKIKIL